jgi:energy-coupling factor transporter transmembrane protein EcfT
MSLEKGIIKHLQSALIYEEAVSFYHNLDPRIKLLYLVITFIMISTSSILKLLIILVFTFVLASLYPRIYRKTLYILIGLTPFMIFTAIFVIIFTVAFGGGTLREATLEQVKVFMRVAAVAVTMTTIALSTTPHEFVHALVKVGFRYTYLYTLIITVRFIPLVFNELSDIYDSQRSRGLELEKGGIRERLRKLNAILIPAFVCSLLRARDLAEALELRGFGYCSKRTFYRDLKLKKTDIVFAALITISAAMIYLLVP